MSIQNYGVLTATVTDKMDSVAAKQKKPSGSPHFEVLVKAGATEYRIAVNVKSDQQPPDLQFLLDENYTHPILDEVKKLPAGFTKLPNKPGTAALDYIRGNLFDFNKMRILPATAAGSANDLNDIFNQYIMQAITTQGALLYAFGSKWGPENNNRDEYFDFLPGNGVHDIHMNQGNKGTHAGDNGVYQDGGLFIFYPDERRWVAMFLKFQSQEVHSDDDHGTPIPVPEPKEESSVKIFAAMVNPKAADPGNEYVYLLNTTDTDINLEGWVIADKLKKKETIRNLVLKTGDVSRINLSGNSTQLSNDGGIITLLNDTGIKIDGVSYTKEKVKTQGIITVF